MNRHPKRQRQDHDVDFLKQDKVNTIFPARLMGASREDVVTQKNPCSSVNDARVVHNKKDKDFLLARNKRVKIVMHLSHSRRLRMEDHAVSEVGTFGL